METEEIYWRQQSRSEWLCEGDRNTAFFHRKASQRHLCNSISVLINPDGSQSTSMKDMHSIAMSFFSSLFQFQGSRSIDLSDLPIPQLSTSHINFLNREVSINEIEKALSYLPNTKAPNPDGMHGIFLKSFWHAMKAEVSTFIIDLFKGNQDLVTLNHTYLILISKVKEANRMTDFCPISLYNSIYKLISKINSNRLKMVLPDLVYLSQSTFVSGGLITDNVIVAHECFHFLNSRNSVGSWCMGIKLDMQKTYSRIEYPIEYVPSDEISSLVC